MMETKSHRLYSDKLRLSVVDLTQIQLATDEDKLYGIDQWASFFKATTWEKIKLIAKSNPAIREASSTMYKLSQEEKIRLECEAREEYYRIEEYRQYRYEKMEQDKEKAEAKQQKAEAEACRYRELLLAHGIDPDQ